MKKFFYLMILLVTLVPSVALAQFTSDYSSSGPVEGKITDVSTGDGLSGAVITASCADLALCGGNNGGSSDQRAYADDAGNYRFSYLTIKTGAATAPYTFKVTKENYMENKNSVTVQASGTVTHNMTMQSAYSTLKIRVKDSAGTAIKSINISVSTNEDMSSAKTLTTDSSGNVSKAYAFGIYYLQAAQTDKYNGSDIKRIELKSGVNQTVDIVLTSKESSAVVTPVIETTNKTTEPLLIATPVKSTTPLVGSLVSPSTSVNPGIVTSVNPVKNQSNVSYWFYVVAGLLVAGLGFVLYRSINKRTA